MRLDQCGRDDHCDGVGTGHWLDSAALHHVFGVVHSVLFANVGGVLFAHDDIAAIQRSVGRVVDVDGALLRIGSVRVGAVPRGGDGRTGGVDSSGRFVFVQHRLSLRVDSDDPSDHSGDHDVDFAVDLHIDDVGVVDDDDREQRPTGRHRGTQRPLSGGGAVEFVAIFGALSVRVHLQLPL